MGSTHIDYKFLFSENSSIQTLFHSLEFVLDGWVGGGWEGGGWMGGRWVGWMFQLITLSRQS